jgi:hypothetical protein
MPWAVYHQLAHGVVVPNKTLNDKAILDALVYITCGDVWDVGGKACVVCSSVNVDRPVMQPKCVPVPRVKEGTWHVTTREARDKLKCICAHPPQHWPDSDELSALKAQLQCVKSSLQWEYYERIIVDQ